MSTNQNKVAPFRVDSQLIFAFPITAIPAVSPFLPSDEFEWFYFSILAIFVNFGSTGNFLIRAHPRKSAVGLGYNRDDADRL